MLLRFSTPDLSGEGQSQSRMVLDSERRIKRKRKMERNKNKRLVLGITGVLLLLRGDEQSVAAAVGSEKQRECVGPGRVGGWLWPQGQLRHGHGSAIGSGSSARCPGGAEEPEQRVPRPLEAAPLRIQRGEAVALTPRKVPLPGLCSQPDGFAVSRTRLAANCRRGAARARSSLAELRRGFGGRSWGSAPCLPQEGCGSAPSRVVLLWGRGGAEQTFPTPQHEF